MQAATGCGWWRRGSTFLILAVVAVAGCSEPPPPPPPPAAAAPAPAPKPISLDPIPELVVRAGTSGTARIEVNRAGHAGEATVTIAPPPDPGLAATADPIAGDTRTGTIVVTAADSLGISESVAMLQVTVTLDGMTAQETLTVKVPAYESPAFVSREPCVLQPGRTGQVRLGVDRKGYPGRPIEIGEPAGGTDGQPAAAVPAEAPREISCVPVTVAADADDCTVELSVAAGVADGPRTVVLSGSSMARSFPVEFSVTVLGRPYAIGLPKAVTIQPGSSVTLPLTVTRAAHAGGIDGTVADLPAGVTAEPVAIGPAADGGTLVLTASSDAPPRVRSAIVRTTGGPFAVEEAVVVRVQRPGEENALPAEITAGEGGRPRKPRPMTGRLSAEIKQSLADRFGGTEASRAAVERGLTWLATVQQSTGGWTLKKVDAAAAADGPSDPEPSADPTLATALGLLPFLGEGISHQRAPAEPAAYQPYKKVVENGLVTLCVNQVLERGPRDGFLGGTVSGHALATQAIAEDYALSGDDRLKLHVRHAVKFLGAVQHQDGSWSHEVDGAGDLPTTCRVIQALRAVQAAGLGTSTRALTRAKQFVSACAAGPDDAPGSRFRPAAGQPASPLATAAGLAATLELGGSAADPDLTAGSRFLLETASAAPGVDPMPYLFLATEAIRSLGGGEFDAWNHATREYLVARQRRGSDLEGSWDPDGADGGRMEATALSLLTLQVYHRRLPIDRGAAKKPVAETDADGESAAADEEP